MSKILDIIAGIEAQIGGLPRSVLIVEGHDDKLFIESLLNKTSPGTWQSHWVIASAGGKGNVLDILDLCPGWFGLIDKDEWTQGELAATQARYNGHLQILPRYCMESYFAVPNELWTMLPPEQQNKVSGGQAEFNRRLLVPLPQWVRHGALWHAVNPLWSGLKSLGFQKALLNFPGSQKTDEEIRNQIQQWNQLLTPQTIMTAFQTNITAASGVSEFAQLTQWVHGKYFFYEHIHQEMDRILGRASQEPSRTLALLQNGMQFPADLRPIWNDIGLP